MNILKIILNYFIFVILLIFISTQFVFAEKSHFTNLHGLGEINYHKVESKIIEQTYHLFVRLPEEYDKNKKYPTIFLLDGGITFPIIAGYYQYLRFGEEIPESIIVGISYGTNDWQKGNMRSRDYTAKAIDRSFWGGAEKFQKILQEEIIALIEKKYSANPDQRIIFGQSLGGQFVIYTAQTAPDLFWGYIASNPALHRNLDYFLEDNLTKSKKLNVLRMFVSSGSEDDPEFRVPALKWMHHWSKKSKRLWFLKTKTLEGHSHFSAVPEAFRQGIHWIFQE